MQLVDTHAHPHMAGYRLPLEEFFAAAATAGVNSIICVGTDAQDSARAVEFAAVHEGCFASVGLHPHAAKRGIGEINSLKSIITKPKVVALGECGLDYHYNHSSKSDQATMLRAQLELGLEHKKPFIFHVREAFDDFFEILDEFEDIRGVVHSFTADVKILNNCLERNLYVGLNGILTFTKDKRQLAAASAVPLDRLLLETDAPYLTPYPHRGTINSSAHVRTVAEFLAKLRGEPLAQLAAATMANAKELFDI